MSSSEQLAAGWKLTIESMGLDERNFPHYFHFCIGDERQIRATRVATLNELSMGIAAAGEDIARLADGAPAIAYMQFDLEQLRCDRAALIELQTRARRSGCLGHVTVIEALFPEIPVKKKTAEEHAEIDRWLAIRKDAALKIDPETAEFSHTKGDKNDPYGVLDEWENPEEFQSYGHLYWARSRKRHLGSFR